MYYSQWMDDYLAMLRPTICHMGIIRFANFLESTESFLNISSWLHAASYVTGFAKTSLMAQEMKSILLLNIKPVLLHYLEKPNTWL